MRTQAHTYILTHAEKSRKTKYIFESDHAPASASPNVSLQAQMSLLPQKMYVTEFIEYVYCHLYVTFTQCMFGCLLVWQVPLSKARRSQACSSQAANVTYRSSVNFQWMTNSKCSLAME